MTARQRSVPALMCGAAGGSEPERLRRAAEQRLQRVAATLEDDVFKLGRLFAQFENLELNLRRRADRRRRSVELVRIGPGERDEFLHRPRRQLGLDHERVGEVASSQTPTKSLRGS